MENEKPTLRPDRCGLCRYVDVIPDAGGGHVGCRKLPPTTVLVTIQREVENPVMMERVHKPVVRVNSQVKVAAWPPVDRDMDWCGEFAPAAATPETTFARPSAESAQSVLQR